MLDTLKDKIDPRWAAVVVVDMQNDFVSPGGVFERTGADIGMAQQALAGIRALIAKARERKVPVCFIRSTYDTLPEVWLHQSKKHPSGRFVDVPVCIEGTWGWQLADGLDPLPGDLVVTKQRYSAFVGTDLDARLRKRGVRSLLVTGVGTAVCVEATARHAFELDYYNLIVSDCCGAYTRPVHEQGLLRLGGLYGEVVLSAEVFAAWH